MLKWKNYVALRCQNDKGEWIWQYVTKIDWSDKMWYTESGKEAVALTSTKAKDLVFGLTANFIKARIETYPDFYEVKND